MGLGGGYDVGGDGRLTGVFALTARTLSARPGWFALLALVGYLPAVGFAALPVMVNARDAKFAVVFLCSALIGSTTLHLAMLPEGLPGRGAPILRILRAAGVNAVGMLGLFGVLLLWGAGLEASSALRPTHFLPVWFLLLLVLLTLLPTGFMLVCPVVNLETGRMSDRCRRGFDLAAGYRWRILGGLLLISLSALAVFSGLLMLEQALKPDRPYSQSALLNVVLIVGPSGALFWILFSLYGHALYVRICHARGENTVPDVASIFA